MKSTVIKSISVFLFLVIGMISCKEVDLTFDQDRAFVAFTDASGSLVENATENHTLEIYYASTTTANVSVTLQFDAAGIDNPAVEGVDFTVVSSKTVSFANNLVQVVEIQAIDNAIQDRDKSVNITMVGDGGVNLGMAGSANASYLLTIVDDEHPLAKWIGTYNVDADSYGDVLNGEPEGSWDEAWEVTTSPVAGDETKLSMVGIAYGDLPVIVSVDLDAMSITFPAGADTGEGYGYGPVLIWRGNYQYVEEADVVGTIHGDGSITVDLLSMVLPDYDYAVWDAFNTTWTRAGKKAASLLEPELDKMNR